MYFTPQAPVVILRNAVADVGGGCISVESPHGRWRLCVSGRRARLEAELLDAELPIDPEAPVHPAVALAVLADVLRAVQSEEWAEGSLKIAVAGPPASGKSTLVRRLLGLPPPAGPTRRPEAYAARVVGAEAQLWDMPGGAEPPPDADCTVVVVPLDVFEEPPRPRGRTVLVASRPPDQGLLELYASLLKPAAVYAMDLRTAPRWMLATAVANCRSS